MAKKRNRYDLIIEKIFLTNYRKGLTEFVFERSEIKSAARELGIDLPENLGDIVYSFRYRAHLPESISSTAPKDNEWIIRPAGSAKYRFVLVNRSVIVPSPMMAETKILDATPGIITRYALNDEQAALAKIRYNRLIDIFTGITCYSLQNHLRTTAPDIGQVETDEIYIGVDKRGAHYILPVQAKGRKDKMGVVQIEQDLQICAAKFPDLICRSIGAQLISEDVIALFEFEQEEGQIKISSERHYHLVKPKDLSVDELRTYQQRSF